MLVSGLLSGCNNMVLIQKQSVGIYLKKIHFVSLDHTQVYPSLSKKKAQFSQFLQSKNV